MNRIQVLKGTFSVSALSLNLTLCTLLAGCSAMESARTKVYQMGERAEVGTLTYTVVEAEWRMDLGQDPQVRMPRSQFLLVRVSATNGGANESAIPAMELISSSGESYAELQNGEGVPEWLGLLRRVQAAETSVGRVVFDAPRGDYRLRVSDDSFDPSQVKLALIEIPLRYATGTSLPVPSGGQMP